LGAVTAVPPFVPRAVVFDLDGVLVDSEGLWGHAEQRVVRELGYRWDPQIQSLLLGRGPDDAARRLAEHLEAAGPGPDVTEVARRLLLAAADEFRRSMAPRAGARELVEDLHGRLPLAVATNSRRVLVDLALEGAGLAGVFTAVVCADDVPAPKPDPAPYLLACRLLGVTAQRSVCIEDSPVGVASAKAAGLWVIGCASLPGQDLSAADVVVERLEDVRADALLAGRAA
jgi:HAD superfamily hydrolase (TIGR01509 family)